MNNPFLLQFPIMLKRNVKKYDLIFKGLAKYETVDSLN